MCCWLGLLGLVISVEGALRCSLGGGCFFLGWLSAGQFALRVHCGAPSVVVACARGCCGWGDWGRGCTVVLLRLWLHVLAVAVGGVIGVECVRWCSLGGGWVVLGCCWVG